MSSEAGSYAAGIGIALFSTLSNALGLLCQKLTHRRLALLAEAEAESGGGNKSMGKRYFTQPLWVLGIGCMVIGSGLSFAVFSFLGQSRASAMAAITILWNGILATMCLGERFSAWDGLVSAVIVCGAVVAVVFGSSGAATQPTDDLPSVITMLSRQTVWVAAIVVIILYFSALATVKLIARKGKARSALQIRIECYLRVLLAGTHTGITGMLASSVVKSISGAAREGTAKEVAGAWQLWVMLLCLPVSLVLQLGFLNSALSQMDALEIVPPYQASVICIGLAWGVVFLGDADTMAPESLGLFCIGCAISCCGVGLISFKRTMTARLDALWERQGWTCCKPSAAAAAASSVPSSAAAPSMTDFDHAPPGVADSLTGGAPGSPGSLYNLGGGGLPVGSSSASIAGGSVYPDLDGPDEHSRLLALQRGGGGSVRERFSSVASELAIKASSTIFAAIDLTASGAGTAAAAAAAGAGGPGERDRSSSFASSVYGGGGGGGSVTGRSMPPSHSSLTGLGDAERAGLLLHDRQARMVLPPSTATASATAHSRTFATATGSGSAGTGASAAASAASSRAASSLAGAAYKPPMAPLSVDTAAASSAGHSGPSSSATGSPAFAAGGAAGGAAAAAPGVDLTSPELHRRRLNTVEGGIIDAIDAFATHVVAPRLRSGSKASINGHDA